MKTLRIVLSVFTLGIYLVLTLATSPMEKAGYNMQGFQNITGKNLVFVVENPADSLGIIIDSAIAIHGKTLSADDTIYYKFFRAHDRNEKSWQWSEESIISFLPGSFVIRPGKGADDSARVNFKTIKDSTAEKYRHGPFSCKVSLPAGVLYVLNVPPEENVPVLVALAGTNEPAPPQVPYLVSFQSGGKTVTERTTGNKLAELFRQDPFSEQATKPVTVINQTAFPLEIIEEGNFQPTYDSGYVDMIYQWPKVQGEYYIFLKNRWGIRYPGFVAKEYMPTMKYKNWIMSNNLQPVELDSFYFSDKKYRITFGAVSNEEIHYWLGPFAKPYYLTRIAAPENYYGDNYYSSYTFIIHRVAGNDTLRLRGKEFYSRINANGELILQ